MLTNELTKGKAGRRHPLCFLPSWSPPQAGREGYADIRAQASASHIIEANRSRLIPNALAVMDMKAI